MNNDSNQISKINEPFINKFYIVFKIKNIFNIIITYILDI